MFFASALVVATLGCSRVQFTTINARSSDSFVDSIGVNTHVMYINESWANWNNIVVPKLLASGIRHVRDGLLTWQGMDSETYVFQNFRQLKGVKLDLITSASDNVAMLPTVQSWLNGAIEAYEGLNEPDISGDPNWAADTIAWQKKLYATVHGSPLLAGVKVLGPSPCGTTAPLGNLAPYADYGNMHPYPGGDMPSTNLAQDITTMTKVTGGERPMFATETGYHYALQDPKADQPAISELAGGKYMPRVLLDSFASNVGRTFIYEFMDDQANVLNSEQDCFGLIGGDGREKPAYTAIKNLIALTTDPGPSFSLGSLGIEMSGNTSSTRTVLLQKRNGTFLLAIWQEVPSWNTTTKTDITVKPTPIGLKFNKTFKYAAIYVPRQSTKPNVSLTNVSTFTVDSLDEVTIVELEVPEVRP